MNLSIRHKINSLINPGETLSQRVARGGIWIFTTRAIRECLRFARTVTLARMLAPDDFGMLGVALLAISALTHFTQTGFQAALVQKKGEIQAYLNTAWIMSGLRGTILCATLVIIAPYVADFFNEPMAAPVIRVVALSLLLGGWSNIGRVYFDKDLEFNKKFAYEIGGASVDLAVAVTAVIILDNVWALVFGLLAGEITRFILSYILQPYRPRLQFDFAKARELFGFGKWVFVSSITSFIRSEGDDVFLGRILGVATLGLYQMAYRISTLPTTEITSVISQISFPTFSKLQDKPDKLRTAYLRSIQLSTALAAPMVGGIFFIAPDFTRIFLTEKWMPMVTTLQVLSIWGLVLSVTASTGTVWWAIGKPQITTYFHIAKLVLLVALIYPFTMWWGMLGTAIAVAVQSVIVDSFTFPVMIRTIKCSTWALLKQVFFPFAATGIMIGILTLIRGQLPPDAGIPYFFMLVTIGILVYGVSILLIERFFNYGLIGSVKQLLGSISTDKNPKTNNWEQPL